MSVDSQSNRPEAETAASRPATAAVSRIAVGVDGLPEGRDAVALARLIGDATGADLMLVTVQAELIMPVPPELGSARLRTESERMLREIRDAQAPAATILAETDFSVARALHRTVREYHRDLLVVGSSRAAPEGRVRLGKRSRQLLGLFDCAVAIAPRGMHLPPHAGLGRIGVGYDGGPESRAALALAGAIAVGAGAELLVRSVVDDRIPVLLRSALNGLIATEWHDVVADQMQRRREEGQATLAAFGVEGNVHVHSGRPADMLLALTEKVDLLVIGSRRWGPTARVLLGSTGEAVMHDARCPVMAVPRPTDT